MSLTNFTDVPVRNNSTRITASWPNALRVAGIALEAVVSSLIGGGGSIAQQSFAMANNQAATNITGMLAVATYPCTRWRYTIKRVGTNTVLEHGELVMLYNGTTFTLYQAWYVGDATTGITFTNVAGQVQYASSGLAGHVSSTIYWNAVTQG